MPGDFHLGDWLIQPTLNRASGDGQTLHVRPKIMDLLVFLSTRPRVVLSKDDLLQAVWGAEFVSESALTSVVAELRQVFHDDVERPWLIETIPKRGYRLIAEVRVVGAAGESSPATPIASDGQRDDIESAIAGDPSSETSSPTPRVALFALLMMAAGAAIAAVVLKGAVTGNGAPRAGGSIREIAVLPFQDLSGNSGDALLADAITYGVISELARLDGFQRVVAHESAMRYKAPRPSLTDIANELLVQGFITGTLARSDNEIRIRVELIDAGTERQLWADTFVRDARAVVDVQRQVVRDIVREARINVTPSQNRRLKAAARATDPQAHEMLVRARVENGRINFSAALRHYEQALARDSNLPEAWAELALLLVHQAYESPAHTVIPRARAAAERALELDPESAAARIALGRIRLHVDWDWDGAGRELQSAVALDRHSPDAHWQYAIYLGIMGRPDESVQEARESVRLDPLSPMTHYELAFTLRLARQYRNAVEEFTRAIALAPDRPVFVAQRALTHALNGDCVLADADLTASGRTTFAAFVAAKCGRHDEARQAVVAMRKSGRCAAEVYAALGDYDAAFACLEERYAERDFSLAQIATAAVFTDLQRDQRFEDLLRRMGYPR